MLDSLRNASRTWVAKVLLGLLVLSFAVWGISGQMFDAGGDDVVTAGDTSVSVLEYRLAYDRRISELSQRFGNRVSREQAQALGLDNQVLAQVAAGAVLDEQARELGLGVSQDKLARLTASDPAFRGPDGNFDRRQFDYVLSQVGMRPGDYISSREQAAVREQVVEAVSDGVRAPDALLTAVALHRGEDRTAEYVALPRSLVEPIDDPSDEELNAWFEESGEAYASPEYRTVSYLVLSPETVADPDTISDEQVREHYEANSDRYTTQERRTVDQIIYDDPEAARAAYESTRTGTTFADLVDARDMSADDARLGTVTRDDIADDAVAEAAFDLRENAISEVVDGSFGHVLLRVTDIEEAETQPLEEVAGQIREELALDEANQVLLDVHDSYEDARAGGASMQEASEQLDLEVRTVEIDSNARTPDGEVVDDLPASNELVREAFATEEGIENPPLTRDIDGFLFYEVDEVREARSRELDEVREEAVEDWKDEQADEQLAALAADYRERIEEGASLDEIAEEAGIEKETKRGLRRSNEDPDLGRAGIEAVFGVPRGGVGTFAGPEGDARYLFEVTEVFKPVGAGPGTLSDDVSEQLTTGISEDLLDQLVAELRTKYEVTFNRTAMEEALSF